MDPAPPRGATEPPRSIPEFLRQFPTTSPRTDSAGAAVVMVLRQPREEIEVLLIERALRENDPASGQVALPGGHTEPSDADLRATATRELDEEVGLRLTDLTGPVHYLRTQEAQRFSISVGVFAVALDPTSPGPTRWDPGEVRSLFWCPRTSLAVTERVERDTHLGLRTVDATVIEGHVLWGFTRRVLLDAFYPA